MGKGLGKWAIVGAALTGVVTARGLAAQDVRPLGEPDARAAEGFTSIFDVAELPDGRVLITDNRERSLAILDLDGGSVRRVGRIGEGPSEFQGVFSILRRPEGYHVYDPGNARFLVVSPDGRITGTERFIRPPFPGLAPPRGPDAGGRVFFELRQVGANGLERPAVIYRWDTQTGRADSVGTAMQYARGQGGPGIVPMPMADAWSVMPDGSVLVVRAEEYPDYPRMPADEAARDGWIARMLARSGGSSVATGGASTRSSDAGALERRVREYRRRLDADRFPEFLPPFEGGYVPAAPWGEVWIRVDPASTARQTVFDVLGRDGRRIRRVGVDGRARIVGFGTESVYIVRTDAYDLEWLERYRIQGG